MTNERAPLFPEFDGLYELIAAEVEGMTDAELDWSSDSYGWAEWSVRNQLSHMASLIYRWLLLRCGDTLFAESESGVEDVEGLAASPFDRRMDDDKYWDIPVVLGKLNEGIELIRRVLSERDAGFLRSNSVTLNAGPGWDLMLKAHPSGIGQPDDSGDRDMNLEAMLRHIYFEETTHLFNIQRIKRAQGLPTVSEVPKVGYWAIDGWDTSEAR